MKTFRVSWDYAKYRPTGGRSMGAALDAPGVEVRADTARAAVLAVADSLNLNPFYLKSVEVL